MKLKLSGPTQKYPCAECTACCRTIQIQEFQKPLNTRCRHENGKCSIYDERPASCREFLCEYAAGLLGPIDQWRPDQCGIMVTADANEAGTLFEIDLYEATPGALNDRNLVRTLVQNVSASYRSLIEVLEIPVRVVEWPAVLKPQYGSRFDLDSLPDGFLRAKLQPLAGIK